MQHILEKFYLPFLALVVKMRKNREEKAVRRNFYHDDFFRKCDQAFLKVYHGIDPFKICKDFLTQKGAKEIYAYGETPLSVWNEIAKRTSLGSKDQVIDLGCGTARGLFFLASYYGCSVIGVDWVLAFVDLAKKVASGVGLGERAHFYNQEILSGQLENATLVYLFGTCLEDELILQLIEKFKKLSSGTKIVTVSFSLNEYCGPNLFCVKDEFEALFPWGRTTLYIQEKL